VCGRIKILVIKCKRSKEGHVCDLCRRKKRTLAVKIRNFWKFRDKVNAMGNKGKEDIELQKKLRMKSASIQKSIDELFNDSYIGYRTLPKEALIYLNELGALPDWIDLPEDFKAEDSL
jgi:hypothetical protein